MNAFPLSIPFPEDCANNMAYSTTSSETNDFITPPCEYVPPVVFHAVLCDYARLLLIVHSNNFEGSTQLEHIYS